MKRYTKSIQVAMLAAAGAVMDTRRYAKRQLTWFRNQMKDWPWAAPEEAQRALETRFAEV